MQRNDASFPASCFGMSDANRSLRKIDLVPAHPPLCRADPGMQVDYQGGKQRAAATVDSGLKEAVDLVPRERAADVFGFNQWVEIGLDEVPQAMLA